MAPSGEALKSESSQRAEPPFTLIKTQLLPCFLVCGEDESVSRVESWPNHAESRTIVHDWTVSHPIAGWDIVFPLSTRWSSFGLVFRLDLLVGEDSETWLGGV